MKTQQQFKLIVESSMSSWKCFLDSLDSGGGHMFVLFLLILGGAGFFTFDPTAGGQIISLAFGALLMKLKEAKSNQEQTKDSSSLVVTAKE